MSATETTMPCCFHWDDTDGKTHDCPLPGIKTASIKADLYDLPTSGISEQLATSLTFCEGHAIMFGLEQGGADKGMFSVD